jgi:hypothetical protein
MCPKWHAERSPCHAAFNAVPFLVCFLSPASVSIFWWICVHIHISDCARTVHELPLLPNNTASETFLHKWVRSKCWLLFIKGAPAWRWLGEYVTLDETFYNLLFEQEVVAAPSYFHVVCLNSFLEHAFIRNIMIYFELMITVICINNNNNNYRRLQDFLLFKIPMGTRNDFFEIYKAIWACALKKVRQPWPRWFWIPTTCGRSNTRTVGLHYFCGVLRTAITSVLGACVKVLQCATLPRPTHS